MSLHIFRALSKQELSGTDCCLFHHTEDKTKTSLVRGPKCAASPDALLMQHWEPLVRETATDPTLFRVEYISMEYQKPYVQCASSFYVWGFETTNLSRVHRFRCCMNCRANAGNLLLDFRTTFEIFDTAVPAKLDQKGQWISIYSVLPHAYNNAALLFDTFCCCCRYCRECLSNLSLASSSLSDVLWRRPQDNAQACKLSKIELDFPLEWNETNDADRTECRQQVMMPSWPSQEEIPCLPLLFDGSCGQRCPNQRLLNSLLHVNLQTDLFAMPDTLQQSKANTQHPPIMAPIFFSGTMECLGADTSIPVLDTIDTKASNAFESEMGKEARGLRQQLVGFAFFENQ